MKITEKIRLRGGEEPAPATFYLTLNRRLTCRLATRSIFSLLSGLSSQLSHFLFLNELSSEVTSIENMINDTSNKHAITEKVVYVSWIPKISS